MRGFFDCEQIIWERCACSVAESQTLAAMVDMYVGLAETIESEGLLALNGQINSLSDPFSKQLLKALVDGSCDLGKLASKSILTSQEKGIGLQRQLLTVKATIMLNEAVSPRTIRLLLTAFLGDTALETAFSQNGRNCY